MAVMGIDRRLATVSVGLLLALAANTVILMAANPALRTLGGILLFCLIPGYLLVFGLLSPPSRADELECLVLGIGTSFALSILAILTLQWLPGPLWVGRLLLANDFLVVVGAGVALLGGARGSQGPQIKGEAREASGSPAVRRRWVLLSLFLAILLLGFHPAIGQSGILRVPGR